MNNQKSGGCAGTLISLALLVVAVPAVAWIAPQIERYPNMPSDSQQIQQIIQQWHGPQLPKIKAPTGEVFTVSVEQ
jgi:hypothetical protein